jgi:DNA recombination protein RmuC
MTTLLAIAASAAVVAWRMLKRRSVPHDISATERAVAPLLRTLAQVEERLRALDADRARSAGELTRHLELLGRGTEGLRSSTERLVSALRAPQVRGRWGEMQLRRVVELAGMTEHADFISQPTLRDGQSLLRPDLIVRLPGERSLIVDAKAPVDAVLDALQAADEDTRRALAARHVRDHVKALSAKRYWAQLPATPEFVVLFLPAEAFYALALQHDPELLDFALASRILIAAPTTLMALLTSAALAWRQDQATAKAVEVLDAGRELHDRLHVYLEHLAKVGARLNASVEAYNKAVGSLHARVLPAASRLRDRADRPAVELTPITAAAAPAVNRDAA